MSLINNIIRKARPDLFSGNDACLCGICDDTAIIHDVEGLEWPCPQCHLGVLQSLKSKSSPLHEPSYFLATAKAIWGELGNACTNDDMELEDPFLHFEAGTDVNDIWHWIEDTFEVSVTEL
ncbi:hypothetical protein [Aeromonas caviae]|uniref:hypothetical protein n=1 Tax=Aeromonas caviae TaxID=648 RepID=UPI00385A09F4